MTILLDPYIIPEKGKVKLKVERSFEIKITAEEAQSQVNRWLLNEVSYLIGADPPALVVGEQVVWRAPAWIGFPHTGRVGVVGMVDVDVTTGAMNNTPECKAEIEHRAEALAARQPLYQPKGEAPETFLPKHIPPAPKVTLPKMANSRLFPSPEARLLMTSIILPVPHILQRQPGECLAACAAMMLTYLALPVNYNRLLKLLQVKPDIGAPSFNIRRLKTIKVDVTYKQPSLFGLCANR